MILTLDNNGTVSRRVATVGSFDGVHRGHRCIIDQLSALGRRLDMPTAAITFRGHPRWLKCGVSPLLTTLDDRLALLAEAGVDDIILLDFDAALCSLTAAEFMTMMKERFGVEAMMLGFNNRFGSDRLTAYDDYHREGERVGVDIYQAVGLRGDDEVSSTAIRRALAEGDVVAAAAMLGRRYRLTGEVVHGRALGRTIGFPTANLVQKEYRCIVPVSGVYAADVIVDGDESSRRRAVMNIGSCPTVNQGDCCCATIEVHILDFDGDLYGRRVSVDFLQRLRDEVHFPDLRALSLQLQSDAAAARAL